MNASRPLLALCLMVAATLAACNVQVPWSPGMAETPARHADEGLRAPPEGSLHRRGEVLQSRFEAAFDLENPLPDDAGVEERGRRLFAIYCTPCHGDDGRGDGPVAGYFSREVPDLRSPRVGSQTDGYIYATIRDGGGSMPGYAGSLDRDERWAIVRHVRGLQR